MAGIKFASDDQPDDEPGPMPKPQVHQPPPAAPPKLCPPDCRVCHTLGRHGPSCPGHAPIHYPAPPLPAPPRRKA